MSRLDRLIEFSRNDPGDAFTRFALALEYVKIGEEERAIEVFELLASDRPDYVGTYYHLGGLYLRAGRTEDALATYREGIRVAEAQHDFHSRSELQSALLEAEGIGFED